MVIKHLIIRWINFIISLTLMFSSIKLVVSLFLDDLGDKLLPLTLSTILYSMYILTIIFFYTMVSFKIKYNNFQRLWVFQIIASTLTLIGLVVLTVNAEFYKIYLIVGIVFFFAYTLLAIKEFISLKKNF